VGVRIEVIFGEEPKDATQDLVEDFINYNVFRREDLRYEDPQEDTTCQRFDFLPTLEGGEAFIVS